MKDFYDAWILSKIHKFNEQCIVQTIIVDVDALPFETVMTEVSAVTSAFGSQAWR